MSRPPLIALVSATFAAVAPAARGLDDEFAGAAAWNLVDDRLMVEADAHGGVTPALKQRMARLIDHAIAEGADAVLLTCSLYGPVAHDADGATVPVLAADDAAFDAVVAGGFDEVLVVGSLESAAVDSASRLSTAVAQSGAATVVRHAVADGALAAASSGDLDELFVALRGAVAAHLNGATAVLLAQYSLAPAAARLAKELNVPVISGPHAAARLLRSRLTDGAKTSSPRARERH